MLFPGEWHRYRPHWEVGWDEWWLSFSGRHADELVRNRFISPADPVFPVGEVEGILHPYLQAIDRLQVEPIGFQQMIANNALEIIVATISAMRSRKTSFRAEMVVCEACAILEQDAEMLMDMERLAASFSMSGKHFRQIFKQQTGMSPYQYHLQVKVYRAKEMLHGTNLSIREISSALHFENQFHFSTAFKQKTGTSPSQWRSGGVPRDEITTPKKAQLVGEE